MEDLKESRKNNYDESMLYSIDDVITKNRKDNKRCRNNINSLYRWKMLIKSLVEGVKTVLVLPGIIAWLIWLTFIIHDNPAHQQHQKMRYTIPHDAEYRGIIQTEAQQNTSSSSSSSAASTEDKMFGFTGVLDINSLFDETSRTLRYLPNTSRINTNPNLTHINQDGSFKILSAGRYLIHSKLALTNEFRRTKSYRQCILLANDESLECDQGSVSHRKKKTSHILRIDYFEQNQILKIIMTNKALVYRDPLYNKLEIVGFN